MLLISKTAFIRANTAVLRWLVIAAFILQSFIPVGMMPDPDAAKDGMLRLVICTGYGPLTSIDAVKASDKTHHSDYNGDNTNHYGSSPCDFSADLKTVACAILPAEIAAIIRWQRVAFAMPSQHPATAVLRKTAPPRAPPVYS